jgi:hypothetical protein
MTKKDFEKVAKILKDTVDCPSLRAMIALEFVAIFKTKNKLFDESKFLLEIKRNTGAKHYYPITKHTIVD